MAGSRMLEGEGGEGADGGRGAVYDDDDDDDDGKEDVGEDGAEGKEEGKRVEEVIFYCKAGVRSRAAARMAREWVGIRVGDMTGGWVEWEGRGGEVER